MAYQDPIKVEKNSMSGTETAQKVPDATKAEQGIAKDIDMELTNDIGATTYAEAQNYTAEELDANKARVKKKLDRILMPLVRTPSNASEMRMTDTCIVVQSLWYPSCFNSWTSCR